MVLRVLFVVGWAASGVLAAGILFAHVQAEFALIAAEYRRQDMALSWLVALAGPVALLIALFATGFAKHGVKWR